MIIERQVTDCSLCESCKGTNDYAQCDSLTLVLLRIRDGVRDLATQVKKTAALKCASGKIERSLCTNHNNHDNAVFCSRNVRSQIFHSSSQRDAQDLCTAKELGLE